MCDAEGEGHPGTDLPRRVIIQARSTQAEVDSEIVFDLPDRSDQSRFGLNPPEIAFVGNLGDRANWPIVRAFEDRTEKQIRMLLPSDPRCSVQVDRNRLPPL